MRKVEMSVDGLRVLRDNAESTLGEWVAAEARNQPMPSRAPDMRDRLREAVREAGDRLTQIDARKQAQEG